MIQQNVYKPRYKIAFQAKSKIWPYKNSRLRRFFNIRGRKLIRRGLFKRYFLVFNNMKWTIARRYIRPYMKKRRAMRRRYRVNFYSKQQLRAFYGKQKEEAFRNFFKKFLGGAKGRNHMFAVALERRLDIFLFRLRFMPTIYACNQFIHHFGIDINGKKEMSPNALVRPGDIVTFQKAQWVPFVEYLYERLYWRVYGVNAWKKRQFKTLRKKIWWCYRNKFFKKSNVLILKKFNFVVRKLLKVNYAFLNYLPLLYREVKTTATYVKTNHLTDKRYASVFTLKRDIINYWKEYRTRMFSLVKFLTRISNKKWRLKLWTWRLYYSQYFMLLTVIFRLYKLLKFYFAQFKILELKFYKTIIELNAEENWNFESAMTKDFKSLLEDQVEKKNIFLQSLIAKDKFLTTYEKNVRKKLAFFKQRYKYYLWVFAINRMVQKKTIKNLSSRLSLRCKQLAKQLLIIQTQHQNIRTDLNNVKTEISQLIIQRHTHQEVLLKEINNKIKNKNKFDLIVRKQLQIIEERFQLFNQKIEFLFNFIIKRRIKRYALQGRGNQLDSNEFARKSSLLFFLTKRRVKKEKKNAIPRLKKVHWYIPPYIYFDVRTLRAVFLYNPRPEEIVFSFKCSLRAIHSFYRSRGV